MRRLFLHVGGKKTGSSALQLFLAANASALRERGVAYRNPPETIHERAITSGNGNRLFHVLTFEADDGEVDGALLDLFGEASIALASSEHLAHLTSGQWERVARRCGIHGIEPRLVMFVRDVYPYYQSFYHQLVKRHGETRTFGEVVREGLPYHAKLVRTAIGVFGQDRCAIHHYETVRDSLDEILLGHLGLDANAFDRRAMRRAVNRSLTKVELDLMLKVNRRLGSSFSEEVSDALIYADPTARPHDERDPAVLEALAARHGSDVAYLNAEFFQNRPVVAVARPREDHTFADRRLQEDDSIDPVHLVLAWALTSMAGGRMLPLAGERIGQILACSPPPEQDGTIPPGFDPAAYLLFNPDILAAGVDPFTHYRQYGRHENRRWRF